jgi:transporter family protein
MICWGIAPIFAKIGLSNISPVVGLTIRTLFAGSIVLSWTLIGGSMPNIKSIPLSTWLLIAIEALLATLIGDLAYFSAIKKGDVSLVTIIMSSSPLITLLVSAIFLGEQITFIRFVGSAIIIIGIILVI